MGKRVTTSSLWLSSSKIPWCLSHQREFHPKFLKALDVAAQLASATLWGTGVTVPLFKKDRVFSNVMWLTLLSFPGKVYARVQEVESAIKKKQCCFPSSWTSSLSSQRYSRTQRYASLPNQWTCVLWTCIKPWTTSPCPVGSAWGDWHIRPVSESSVHINVN